MAWEINNFHTHQTIVLGLLVSKYSKPTLLEHLIDMYYYNRSLTHTHVFYARQFGNK